MNLIPTITEKRERRAFHASELRITSGPGKTLRISGHAAVFNQLSEDLGGFREMVMPGAFSKSIKNDDIRALFNHDSNLVLGRNKAGTLSLSEDPTGLMIDCQVP